MAWGGTSDPQEFKRASDWFTQRVPMRRAAYDNLALKWRRYAFTVANASQTSIVHSVWQAADRAVRQGVPFDTFRKEAAQAVLGEWGGTVKRPAHRLETVYRNALQSSYNAGRHAQMTDPAILAARPVWIFDAMLDQNTTDICRARDGIRRRHDDAFWRTNYPPLHHRCRTVVRTARAAAGETDIPQEFDGGDVPPPSEGWGATPTADEWQPDVSAWPVKLQYAYQQKQKAMGVWKPVIPTVPPPPPPTPMPPQDATPPAPPRTPPRLDTTEATIMHRQVAGARGSNPGGVYEGADGVQRYVKLYDDPLQAYGEHVANRVYRDLGLHAPDSIVFHLDDGRVAYASRMLRDAKQVGRAGLTPDVASDVLDGYMADVLTANWDAVGLSLDNIVTANGRLYRIDNGGSFFMRAQRGRKPTHLLTQATELDGFADPNINPAYRQVLQAAGVSGPDDPAMARRLLRQLDDIDTLAASVGSWDDYVMQVLPSASVEDRRALAGLLRDRAAAVGGVRGRLQAATAARAARSTGPLAWDAQPVRQMVDRMKRRDASLPALWEAAADDEAMMKRARRTISGWTRTYSDDRYQERLRGVTRDLLAGRTPTDPGQIDVEAVAWLIQTRRQRWERLAPSIGMAGAPDELVLYRGVGIPAVGDPFLDDVARAWAAGADTMTVRSRSMASWSLDPNNGFAKAGAVRYRRTFTLDETFADQILDDGSFASAYLREHEVISLQTADDTLTVPTRDVRVNYKGRYYGWDDRDAFLRAYRANGGKV